MDYAKKNLLPFFPGASTDEQLHFLQTLINSIASPVFYKDRAGIYQGCNKAFEEYLGKSKAEIVGKSVYDLAPPDLAAQYEEMDRTLFEQGGQQTYEASVVYADGSRRDVLFNKSLYHTQSGELAGLVGIIWDITERKRLEQVYLNTQTTLQEKVAQRTFELQKANETLREKVLELEQMTAALSSSEEKFSKAFHYCSDAIGLFRLHDERYIEVNDAFIELFGYSREEIINHKSSEFGLWLHAEERANAFKLAREQGSFRDLESAWLNKNGDVRIGLCSAASVEIDGETCILFIVHDFTERKRIENELRATRDDLELQVKRRTQELYDLNSALLLLSSSDGLTGLANRRALDDFLERQWQQCKRRQTPLALIMIDVDFFKEYNDLYGHLSGDECLKKVARTLQHSLKRSSDFAARFGGEEFAAVLPDTDLNGAALLAEELRAAIEALGITHHASAVGTVLTISLGVTALIPQKNDALSALLDAADQALYKAKRAGRNRVERA